MPSLFCICSYDLSDRQRQYIEKRLADEIPVDIRPLDPEGHFRVATKEREPKQMYWVRAKGYIGRYIHIGLIVGEYLWYLINILLIFLVKLFGFSRTA